MSKTQDLRNRYYETVRADLTALEGDRKKTQMMVLGLWVLETVAIFGPLLWTLRGHHFGVLFLVVLWAGFGYVTSYNVLRRNFGRTFKERVVKKLVTFVDPSLKYKVDGGIPEKAFLASALYPGQYKTYHTEDHVWGTASGAELAFSELDVYRGFAYGKVSVFRGLFFVIKLPHTVHGRITIVPDPAGRTFARLNKAIEGRAAAPEGARVGFDDAEFERIYEVYAQQEHIARRVLTNAMRRRLVRFRKRAVGDVSVAFVQDTLYMGIETGARDMFEPPIFKSLLDPRPLQEYVDLLSFAAGIMADLNAPAPAQKGTGTLA